MSSKSPTTVHYKYYQEPYLKGDDIVVIQPEGQFGVYRFPRDLMVEPLLPKRVNIAVDFTTAVENLPTTGSPAPQKKKITELDVDVGSIAQYWVIPIDPGIQFEVAQPSALGKFRNKEGAIKFDKGDIDFFLEHRWYSMIPQIWIVGNETPPTITATSEDMEDDLYDARLAFFGYRYPLQKLEGAERMTARVGPHLTITVGAVGA